MSAWLSDGYINAEVDEVHEYSKEETRTAHLDPVFMFKTPKVRLAKDEMGAA